MIALPSLVQDSIEEGSGVCEGDEPLGADYKKLEGDVQNGSRGMHVHHSPVDGQKDLQ